VGKGFSVTAGWVDEYDAWAQTTMQSMARHVARREDERLVAVVVAAVGLPFPVTVHYRPDTHTLDVRVPGHTLVSVTQAALVRAADTTQVAHFLGLQARRAWFRTPALPVPSNVVLGEN